jgi:ComF family protein
MFNLSPFLNSFLAQNCLFCGDKSSAQLAVCAACLKDLPWHRTTCCPQCGLDSASNICGRCLKDTPYYDNTVALFDYTYPIDSVLQHFKYHHALHLTHTLGALLSQKLNDVKASKISTTTQMPDALLAMPLHPKRLQERGFNQSLEIAKVVAKNLGIPLLAAHTQRIKNTIPQAQLKLKGRASNIKGAFSCDDLAGKRVALIDDVMTSGASLNELAKTAKQAGATDVSCWVLARTM